MPLSLPLPLLGLFTAVALLLLALLFAVHRLGRKQADREILALFGLKTSVYRLVSTDLGRSRRRLRLYDRGIVGEPDALFISRAWSRLVVGEFKSRNFKGSVKPYELFQLMLYLGMAAKHYPQHTVIGVLAYPNHRVQVAFDSALYQALLELQPELVRARLKKMPPSSDPLQRRMNVLAKNAHIRF